MQREIHKLSVNQVVKKLVPTSKGQLWMNELQLKRPYGRFVNKCMYNIHHESCKVLSSVLEEWGERNAAYGASDIFAHLCFVENNN